MRHTARVDKSSKVVKSTRKARGEGASSTKRSNLLAEAVTGSKNIALSIPPATAPAAVRQRSPPPPQSSFQSTFRLTPAPPLDRYTIPLVNVNNNSSVSRSLPSQQPQELDARLREERQLREKQELERQHLQQRYQTTLQLQTMPRKQYHEPVRVEGDDDVVYERAYMPGRPHHYSAARPY